MQERKSEHRNDLDWLRVLSILVVFIFHCGRFFDTDGWHVKNPVRHEAVMVWTGFLVSWMMPLMFLISGASIWYALKSKGAGVFIRDRALRLLVPLVVGIFSHIALQVYLERRSFSGFEGSFFRFYPVYFHGWYGFGGNFAWMGLHLWYLEVLFVFSMLLLPLFRFLRGAAGNRVLDRFSRIFGSKGAVYMLAIPSMVLMATLSERSFWGQRGFGGWPLPVYLWILLFGYLLVSRERLEQQVERLRWASLQAGGLVMLASLVLWKAGGEVRPGTVRYMLLFFCFALGSWCLVLGLFGLGHQTVILTIGYFVVRWNLPDSVKFLVIAISSFGVIVGCYELGVRRYNTMRFLFGMKPLPGRGRRVATAVTATEQVGAGG